jgi:hypothetical protein
MSWWSSKDAPQIITVFLDGEGPYGDSYQLDSENSGPYGETLINELIPKIEATYRIIGSPQMRFVDGCSTGGWVSLALQLYYPDSFNGCWSYSPDPVSFEKMQLMNIYEDKKLHLEVTKLKFGFLNNAQALLHGDLHTGSVFINKEHTFIFDPEFAFYGPMGYDIGNVIANLFFAWCNGDALIEKAKEKEEFCSYILETIAKTVDLFNVKFDKSFKENVQDRMAKTDGFMEYYHNSILADTAGYTGLELIRRISGMAKVIDITNIKNEKKRVRAERILIAFGKRTISNAAEFKTGSDYIDAFRNIVAKF